MKSGLFRITKTVVSGAVLAAMVGCGSSVNEPGSPMARDARLVAPEIGRPSAPGVEVTPCADVPMGGVEVPMSGGSGGKTTNLTGGGGSYYKTCIVLTHDTAPAHVGSDPNTNTQFEVTGLTIGEGDWRTQYLAGYEPSQVVGDMGGAVSRAGAKWATVVGTTRQLGLQAAYPGWVSPAHDGINTAVWARFRKVSPLEPDYVAAIFLWHDDLGQVLGYDVLFNQYFDWEVNVAIAPGGTQVGTFLDVQSAVTAMLGHLLGLENLHSTESNATLSGHLGTGELNKQTLTPGEVNGIGAIYGS